MRPRSPSSAAVAVLIALTATSALFSPLAHAYNPPDQRTIYDEWIRDSQAKRAAEARDKKLWSSPPQTQYNFNSGIDARLARESREAWEAGERRMRERNEAREAARRAREAETRALLALSAAAEAGDPDALMTTAARHAETPSFAYGLREYSRVRGPRQREALWRMVEILRVHQDDNYAFLDSFLTYDGYLRQLALLGDSKAAGQFAQFKLETNDYHQAGIYFAQAGIAGDAAAQKQLIRLVADDRIDAAPMDATTFYNWCRDRALKGDIAAQWAYGNALGVGGEIKAQPAEALKWLRNAAGEPSAKLSEADQVIRGKAATLAGVMLLEGRGVPRDVDAGIQFLKTATYATNPDAMLVLGRAFFKGIGESLRPDNAVAIEWLEKAANAKFDDDTHPAGLALIQSSNASAQSTELLAAIYLQEDLAAFDELKGVEWLRKAAKRRPKAMIEYGRILATGEHGVARDQDEAFALFSTAIQHYPNDPDVLEFIGAAYLSGNYGIAENPEKGVSYLKRAAAKGSVAATARLAELGAKS